MKPNDKKEKAVRRAIPCPSYDIAGLESWLGDMAREGLVLKKHGAHFCFFTFCKETPRQLTYRLEAATNNRLFDDADNRPDHDAILLYRDFGWEYIARYQNFDIYCTADATPRELNTDPALHAMTLNMVKKRQLNALLLSLFQLVVYYIVIRKKWLLAMLQLGSPLVLGATALLLYHYCCTMFEVAHLAALRKQLRTQGEISHRKNWKTHQKRFLARTYLSWVATALCALCFCRALQADAAEANPQRIADAHQDPPFATLVDLLGDDASRYTYTPQDVTNDSNTIKQWHDLLAPQNIEWDESATIQQDGVLLLDAYYSIKYHQLASPWLARQLAKEYSHSIANGFSRSEPVALACPPEVDYFAIYDTYLGGSFVIQQGDKVAYVTLWDYNHDDPRGHTPPFTTEECAARVAQSLLS